MALSTASGSIDNIALEQQLNLANDILRITETIREELSGIRFIHSDQTDLIKEQAKQYKKHAADIRRSAQYATSTKHLQQDILAINDRLGLEYIKQEAIEKRIHQQKTIATNLEKERTAAKDAYDDAVAKGLIAESSEAEDYLKYVKLAIAANESNLLILNKINNSLEGSNKLVIKTTSKSKALQEVLNKISNIPIVGKFLEAEAIFDAFSKNTKTGFVELGSQLKTLLKSPLVALAIAAAGITYLKEKFKQAINMVLEVDKSIVAVANSLGMAREGADLLVRGVYNSEKPVGQLKGLLDEIFITTGNISKAIVSLQDSFGVAAIFNREMVQSQILLTEQLGFSQEEAAGIQKYFYTSGVSAKGVLDTITKTNKYFLNNRKLISEISKVNSEIATSYKNQVGLIANAVVQAGRLGMTLDDTRKISDSLLNFESSIENELKAELLLGRQLNFEKARSLALDGKSAEAAALLVEETGGLNRLNQLNVIQRKALAESIGLSAEELTKFAQQEQIIQRAGFDTLENTRALYEQYRAAGEEKKAQALLDSIAKQQNGEMLAQDIARVDINKRFEQSMLKLKDIFATLLAGPLTGILESFANLLKNTTLMKPIIATVVGLAVTLASALTAAAIAITIASGGLNLAGAAMGLGVLAAVGTGLSLNMVPKVSSASTADEPTEIKDGVISPKGKLMISTPEGQMFQPGNKDYLYATPTPPNQMLSKTIPIPNQTMVQPGNKDYLYDTTTPPNEMLSKTIPISNQTIYNNIITNTDNTNNNINNTSNNNQETNSLLKEMVALMRAGGVVNMDGIKVGEVIGRSNISFG